MRARWDGSHGRSGPLVSLLDGTNIAGAEAWAVGRSGRRGQSPRIYGVTVVYGVTVMLTVAVAASAPSKAS
jgi:hypothetical protein